MSIHEPWNLTVSHHSIIRYRERSNQPNLSEMRCANNLRSIVANGREMVPKNEVVAVRQLLAHDCRLATYHSQNGLMVVVEEGSVIVTVHSATAAKWKEKE